MSDLVLTGSAVSRRREPYHTSAAYSDVGNSLSTLILIGENPLAREITSASAAVGCLTTISTGGDSREPRKLSAGVVLWFDPSWASVDMIAFSRYRPGTS